MVRSGWDLAPKLIFSRFWDRLNGPFRLGVGTKVDLTPKSFVVPTSHYLRWDK